MLQPSRVKYRYTHLGRARGKATSGNRLVFGEFGISAEEPCFLTARQIEAARRAIVGYLKEGVKVWVRIFPDKGVTKKPAESRMGGGKGGVEYWAAVVKRGRILFEFSGVKRKEAEEAFRRASHKLPIKTRFLCREDEGSRA